MCKYFLVYFCLNVTQNLASCIDEYKYIFHAAVAEKDSIFAYFFTSGSGQQLANRTKNSDKWI